MTIIINGKSAMIKIEKIIITIFLMVFLEIISQSKFQLIILNNLLLLSMESIKQFQASTIFFYQNKLNQSLLAINRSINLRPSCSIAYSNRAIILQHLGHYQQAEEDLIFAITLNPLNYVAYFNLSSLLITLQRPSESLKQLCCGISALRLICGRFSKNKEQVLSSLQICNNNYDAFVLMILMELAEEQYSSALTIVQKYGRMQSDSFLTAKLGENLAQLVKTQSSEDQQSIYQLLQRQVRRQRLKCSIQMEGSLLQEEIEATIIQKISQFNRYYSMLNRLLGKTLHIPKKTGQYPIMDRHSIHNNNYIPFFHGTEVTVSH